MTDVIAGQVQAFVITVSTASGFIKAGKVRPLAVTGATRSDVLPDIPSIGETLPGFDAATWNGVCVPKGAPARRHRKAQWQYPRCSFRSGDQGADQESRRPNRADVGCRNSENS